MSDRLMVAIDTLRAAGRRIDDAAQAADHVHGAGLALKAEAKAAGQADAAKGLEDLFGRWGYGAGHLASDARELAKALGMVIDALTQIDQQLSAAVTPTEPGAGS